MKQYTRHAAAASIIGAILAALVPLASLAQAPKPMKESELRAAAARQLTGAELKQTLLGNNSEVLFLKDTGPAKAGAKLTMYFRDERTRLQLLPDKRKQEANWWIEGNTICLEQLNINAGHVCYSAWDAKSAPGALYFCVQPGGDCPVTHRVMPGNPQKL